MKSLKIKVCGMRDAENIVQLIELPIDYIGFIFYEKSPRYVALMPQLINSDKFKKINKVGVFVNADIDFVLDKITKFGLNTIQLHGKETPQYLMDLRIKIKELISNKLFPIVNNLELKINIWKAFSIDEQFDFNNTKPYEGIADVFLFDTKTPQHGGSGQKFNWDLLQNYHGKTPFFLSGGISASDTEGVNFITHPKFSGLDLNSKFEISPAFKDVELLKKFINSVHFS